MEGDLPPLDTFLGRLPTEPEYWYVHDVAILPEARGSGAGTDVVRILMAAAHSDGLAGMRLVAIAGSASFWSRNGFSPIGRPDLRRKLATYGAGAALMERPASPESDRA